MVIPFSPFNGISFQNSNLVYSIHNALKILNHHLQILPPAMSPMCHGPGHLRQPRTAPAVPITRGEWGSQKDKRRISQVILR